MAAMDGGNVGLAGALTDPADRPDISAVSAAAPEAQKIVTAMSRFRSNVFFKCHVANTLSFEIRLSGLLKPAIVRRQTTR
jgi:hypothetical protein